MSLVDICAPAEAEGTRLQVLRWLKQVGQTITQDEPLIEIETDKVTVEVAAPASGTLREILKQEHDEVQPGELLGRLEQAGAAIHDSGTWANLPALQAKAPAPPPPPVATPRAASAPSMAALSPAVRRLLSEHGLEASQVAGSGPGGRLMVEDVLHAAASAPRAPVAAPAPEPRAPASAAVAADDAGAGVRRVPHSAVRRRIAEHMVTSLLHSAPHVTAVFEADMSAVLGHRAQQREAFARQGVPLTLTAYFVRAAVAAIAAVPEANSRWTDAALEIFAAVHMGIGTAVEGQGLMVPVLRDAHARDLLATARGLDELTRRARAGKLTPQDVRGGTFTISNHGVSGSLLAAPIIINQPQSAILGVGKLEKRVAVISEQGAERLVVQPRCYVTLTLDHRVMDGAQANHFMTTFVQTLQQWPS
jgi:2-oxoglutarate dehydrogenase E2 component (dihydrolipoamide succinyltransferase)